VQVILQSTVKMSHHQPYESQKFSKNKTYDLENNLNPKTNNIQPVLKSLEKKFMDLYIPNRAVTIDESLLF
jgi:hypothetical protein